MRDLGERGESWGDPERKGAEGPGMRSCGWAVGTEAWGALQA